MRGPTLVLRPSECREILHFIFSFLLPFFFFFSHKFFSLFVFFPFSFFSFSFLFLSFGLPLTELSKEETSSPFPSCHLSPPCFSAFFFYFFTLFYYLIPHVANCEPSIQVNHMALAMCHSPRVPCGIPTPHSS